MSNKVSPWRKVWVVFMGAVVAPAFAARFSFGAYQWTSTGYDLLLQYLWGITPTLFENMFTYTLFKIWTAVVFVVSSAMPFGTFWGYVAIRMVTLQDWLTISIIAILLMCVRPPVLPDRLKAMLRR